MSRRDPNQRLSNLLTQRSMLLAVIFCIAAFVLLSTVDKVFGSATLKDALLGVVAALLGAATAGLLWEASSKRAFSDELELRFAALIDSVARGGAIAVVAE